MAAYGATLQEWADKIEPLLIDGKRDWSIDTALYLGLAYLAAKRLEKLGVQLTFGSKKLLIPALEQAWRELLFIRLKKIPENILAGDIERQFSLSKAGRILDADKTSLRDYRRYYSDPYDQTLRGNRDAITRRKKRVWSRRDGEPAGSTSSGSGNGRGSGA